VIAAPVSLEVETFAEWQTRTLPHRPLTDADHVLIERLAKDRRVIIDELATGLRVETRAWIGKVRFSGFELHITPKHVGGALPVLRMIEFSRGLEGLRRMQTTVKLAVGGEDLLDLLALLLAEETDRLLRDGLLQNYVTRDEALSVVRGQLRVLDQATRHPGRLDVLECRFDELETDIDENRLVALGLEFALQGCRDPQVRRRVRLTRSIMVESCDPSRLDWRWVDGPIEYHRRNAPYRQAHEYARLLIEGLGIRDLYQTGSLTSSAFLINMNALFEAFVGRLLEVAFASTPVEVDLQRHLRGRIVDGLTGHTYAPVIPDIVLRDQSTSAPRSVPVDVKYKLYAERAIDPGDLYQLFFYAFALAAQVTSSSEAPPVGLIYPATAVSTIDLRFKDLQGSVGAHLYGLGLDVRAALDALDAGSSAALPIVQSLQALLAEAGSA